MSVNTKVNGQLVKSAGLYSVTAPIGMADIYSTEEKEVGLWIDNKPLYQKVVIINSLPSSVATVVSYPHGISNIEQVCDYEGIINYGNGTIAKFDRFALSDNGTLGVNTSGGFTANVNKTNINLIVGTDRSALSATFIIKYTKTTDTPWSGKFVPQGYGYVSSGDIYSFEERKVGVWADGKPLYQKSIKLDDVTVPQSSRVLIGLGTYISNIDNIIGGEVIIIDGSTNVVLPAFQIATISQYGLTYTINKADGIVISRGSDSGAVTRDFIATVRYTKTTDVAGSGEYVPSGDKAEHYSANEEVIGTFMGETLYRKVIPITANWDFTANTWVKSNIPKGDIKAMINGRLEIFYNDTYSLHFIQLGIVDNMIAGNSYRQFSAVANGANLILEYTKTS